MAGSDDSTKLAMEVGKLIGDRCANEIRNVESSLRDRIDMHHREQMEQIEKVKETQVAMQVTQARIETRLDEGERRFADLEDRVSAVEDLEPRIVGLEQRELERAKSIHASDTDPEKRKRIILIGGGIAGAGGAAYAIIQALGKLFSSN